MQTPPQPTPTYPSNLICKDYIYSLSNHIVLISICCHNCICCLCKIAKEFKLLWCQNWNNFYKFLFDSFKGRGGGEGSRTYYFFASLRESDLLFFYITLFLLTHLTTVGKLGGLVSTLVRILDFSFVMKRRTGRCCHSLCKWKLE